jgi:hypothetical protein
MYGIHYFCNCYYFLYICRIDCYGYIVLNYLDDDCERNVEENWELG